MVCWSCVDDQRNSAVKFIENVLGGGWTDPAETICTWRGKWLSKQVNDFSKDGMCADSHGDHIKTRSNDFRNDPALR
jgi:hypothetical protein